LQQKIGNQAVTRLLQAKLWAGQSSDVDQQTGDRRANPVGFLSEAQVQRQPEQEQQEEVIQRQAAHPVAPSIQKKSFDVPQSSKAESPPIQRQGHEGTTRFEEHMTSPPTQQAGIWQGTVDRQVIAPASSSLPQQTIHTSHVNLQFDPSTCTVIIPHRFAFQQLPQSSTAGICAEPPPTIAVSPLPADLFNQLKRQYIETLNERLQGWYAARFEGCQSAPCAGQQISIRINAQEDQSNPETTINIVNRGGRADAGNLCARNLDQGTIIHEGGHQVLGAGDEYREKNPAVCRMFPEWCRKERVWTTDWSYMSEHHAYGRFALFHERHFQFVREFLQAVQPSCQVLLVELRRPLSPDFRLSYNLGYTNFFGGSGISIGMGLGIGIPLNRQREWNLLLGVHGHLLSELEQPSRQAFLLGARLGLDHTVAPSAGGFQMGAFTELGYSSGSGIRNAPYGELGLSAGYALSPPLPWTFGVEAAVGTQFGSGRGGEPGGVTSPADREAQTLHWFRLGLAVGGRF
jgi:hypothetical protein